MIQVLAQIVPNIEQKYVVIQAPLDRLLICGDPKVKWHKDIVVKVLATGVTVLAVLGGGRILVKSETKTIHIWDKSSRYGSVPDEALKEIYEQKFKGYLIISEAP